MDTRLVTSSRPGRTTPVDAAPAGEDLELWVVVATALCLPMGVAALALLFRSRRRWARGERSLARRDVRGVQALVVASAVFAALLLVGLLVSLPG